MTIKHPTSSMILNLLHRKKLRPQKVHFIIGAMKCGTTSLYASLKKHPEVCAGIKKEPMFFAHDDQYALGVDYYHSLWPTWDGWKHKVALDGSTNYTKSGMFPSVAQRIHAYNPEAKFIYLVRNPYERISSHYKMALGKGWQVRQLKDGVGEHMINISQYYSQLEKYLQLFPKEAILVISLDELKETPQTTYPRICKHLGINVRVPLSFGHIHNSQKKYLGGDTNIPATEYTLTERHKDQIYDTLLTDMLKLQHAFGINVNKWGF